MKNFQKVRDLHEDHKHSDVHVRVASRVEDCQEYQAQSSDDCEGDRETRENLLRRLVVLRQTRLVTEPALSNERQVEDNDHGG